MIRNIVKIFRKYRLWFNVIIILNIIFGVLLWLVDTKAFIYIFPTMILGSIFLYCAVSFVVFKLDLKRMKELEIFFNNPNISKEKEVISLFYEDESEIIKKIGEILRENRATIKSQSQGIEEYEEYIEAWAHEIKTPLGLITLVLDNRRDEISPIIYKRLEYGRTKIQEDIERMLYYARLKAARNDYFFRELSLKSLCNEVLEEYEILLREHKIDVRLDLEDFHILSDKKGIQFIIVQIISNAIKYKKYDSNHPMIEISSFEDKKSIRLIIKDNGMGVKAYDLPLIFEKGFTGEIGEQRKNSTGMGLYLAKEVAENLNIELKASVEYSEGFEISLVFPKTF